MRAANPWSLCVVPEADRKPQVTYVSSAFARPGSFDVDYPCLTATCTEPVYAGWRWSPGPGGTTRALSVLALSAIEV
jgi:hypothetical protein